MNTQSAAPTAARTPSPIALVAGLVVVTWAVCSPATQRDGLAAAAEGLPVMPPTRQDPVRFQDEILPILAANCTACHNPKTHEGGLVLDTLPAILKGGDAGPAAVAGKPAESVLFLRAAHRQDDPMPPADNKVGAKSLSPAQLGLLERWIAEGAQTGPAPTRQPIAFKPLPPGSGAVVATAITRDGRLTAAARGSRVSLFDTLSGRLLGTLLDPTIPSSGGAADVAHRDVVSAVEFAPGGDLVATGSFRTIKLWRRRGMQKIADVPGSAGAVAAVAAAAGTQVAVGLPDGKILICDAATGTVAHTLAAHAAAVSGLAFGGDGVLFSAARDGSVVATRIADGVAVGKLARSGEVRAIAIVDSNRLATAEADNAIRIWTLPLPAPDAAAPTPVKELSGIGQPTAAVCDVPTLAGHLVSGSADGVVRLWNLEAGSVVRQFAHGGAITALAARPDGSRLASAGTVPGVKVWETATGKLVAEPKGDVRIADRQRYAEYDVAVAKQDVDHGKAQFTAAEKAIQAAAEETKKAAEKFEAAKKAQAEKAEALAKATAARTEADTLAAAAAAAMTPAMEAVAAATKAGEAAKAAAEAATATAAAFEKAAAGDPAAAEGLKNVQAAAAAATTAKTAADQAIVQANQQVERAKARMAETAKKAEEAVKPQEAAAEAKKQADMGVGTAERGIEFAKQQTERADADLPVRKQEADKAGERLAALEAAQKQVVADATGAEKPVVAVRFTRDGTRLACLGADGRIVFVDPGDGLPRQCFEAAAGAAPPTFLAVADGDAIVVAGGATQAATWAAADGWTLDRTIGGEQTLPATDDEPAGPPVDAVLALAFSPDGATVASGSGRPSRSGEIKLWKVADGSLVRALATPHSDTVMTLEFSRSGDRLASGATDRLAKVHVVADGRLERTFEGHTGHVLGVAWQAHGRRLATAGADGAIKVWDVLSGEQQRSIAVGRKEVTAIEFLPPGEEFAAASGEPAVRLYNAGNGSSVRQYETAGDFVQSLALAGASLAAGTQDGKLRIWNVASGAVLHTVEPSPAPAAAK